MKNALIAACFCAAGLGATAQTSFDVGLFGMASNNWIMNNNVADQGADQDFVPTFNANFGASAALRLSPEFAVTLEVAKGNVAQSWRGEIDTGEKYESSVHMNTLDIPLGIRVGEKGYFELGGQYSMLSGHSYERSSDDIDAWNQTADVDSTWGNSNMSAYLGFGVHAGLSDKLFLVAGLRFNYGFTDLEGTDAFNNSFKNDDWLYEDPEPNNDQVGPMYKQYEKSYALSAALKLGLVYRFGGE